MSMAPGIYVVEHKTTALEIGAGSSYWRRLTLDSQISNYQVGCRSLGHVPTGVLYDVIRKPQIRPYKATPIEAREYTKPKDRACKECKKKTPPPLPHVETVGEGDEAREVTCVDGRIVTDPGGKLYGNMREFDETPEEFATRLRADIGAAPEKYYQRGTIVRLEEEERDAARDTWELARQMREAQLAKRWPRNPDACDAYGSFCQYFPVCSGETTIDDPLRYRDAGQPHEELSKPLPDGKRHLPIVSTSSMKSFRSCQRKYFYGYELGRRSISESDALRFGTLVHKALEVWWQTVDIEQALAAMAGEADPFERVKAEELMRGYHAMWAGEPFEVLAVEAEFVAPLTNPETGRDSQTWQRGGKIDALVRVGREARVAA